jgi:hypothetical protein
MWLLAQFADQTKRIYDFLVTTSENVTSSEQNRPTVHPVVIKNER